ncbi:FAD-binding oxidoreductase, partial [Chloroflexota bacterium]
QHELKVYSIDDRIPILAFSPAATDHICQVVRAANRDEMPVIPLGNGSKQAMGLPSTMMGIVLSLKKVNHLLELDAANLTVEVEAGIGHAELQKELAKHGLYFPLDPEDMATATIGGSLATNSSGPGRLAHGTARDLVLGVTAVIPTGEEIHAGIKTMLRPAQAISRFLGDAGSNHQSHPEIIPSPRRP